MATAAAKRSPKTAARKSTKPAMSATNAVRLLTADHRDVKAMFQDYQSLVDHDVGGEEKLALAQRICQTLTVHAQIEEEIFYPAAQAAIKEPDLVDEANVEHASAKELIAQIESSDPSDKLFDAKVKVLGEYIDHHVKEEEGELFPQARRAKLDLEALGKQLQARKEALMAELGVDAEEEATA